MSDYECFWAIVVGVMLGQWLGDFLRGFLRGIRSRIENQKVAKNFAQINKQELDDILKR